MTHPFPTSLSRAAGILSGLACLLSGSLALAQSPSNVAAYDAQVPYQFTNGNAPSINVPYGVAVAPDGTVYVVNTPTHGDGTVIRITPSTGYVTGTGCSGNYGCLAATATTLKLSVTLTKPTALAVDSLNNLYIADSGNGHVYKVAGAEGSGTLTATAITSIGTNPTALAVDTTNNLFIADRTSLTSGAFYEVAFDGTKGANLNITTTGLKPLGIAVDATDDIFFADNSNQIYKIAHGGTTASVFLSISSGTYAFKFSSVTAPPIGMGFDPLGNLFVMDSDASHLFEIATNATWYLVPFSNANNLTRSMTPTSIAVGSTGNLYVGDDTNNTVDLLYYENNPVNFGSIDAGTTSPNVVENFLFNNSSTTTTTNGLSTYQGIQGDNTGEFAESNSSCSGTSQSADSTCSLTFDATYLSTTPGLRNGVVGLVDSIKNTYAVRAIGISLAAALDLYPGTQNTLTGKTLVEPQGLAVTGNGGTLFVADEGGVLNQGTYSYNGEVYTYSGSTYSSTINYVSPATPLALAVDAAGNLYIGDYNGKIYVIQPVYNTSSKTNSWTGFGKPLTLAVTLYHPMALAFDPSGNLFIGDMGSQGTSATATASGFIVEVPKGQLTCGTSSCSIVGVSAFQLTNTSVGGIPIVFPQALTTDNSGNLYIADGGDGDTDLGGVDVMTSPVASATPSQLSFTGYTLNQPAGLSIDAANDLYVLDGYNTRVLVAHISGTTPAVGSLVLLGNNEEGNGSSGITTALVTPSNLLVWPGGQNLTITDIGFQPQSGTATPAFALTLNGATSTLDVGSGSGTVLGVNVGNVTATFANNSPEYSGGTSGFRDTPYFSLSGCGSAGGTLAVGIGNTCTSTITYNNNANGKTSATFTLVGNATDDYSTLGNQIHVSSSSNTPDASLTAPTFSFSQSVTATLENIGGGSLVVNSISVSGPVTYTGGTCTSGTTLTADQSCTITYLFNNNEYFVTGTVTVNDTTGSQSASTFFLFSFSFFDGDILGGANLNHPLSDQTKVGLPTGALNTGGNNTLGFGNPTNNEAGNAGDATTSNKSAKQLGPRF